MHGIGLIATLTGCLTAALALGYVTHRLGLSPIVGYLLAGMLVGPHTPGFVADVHLAEQLAEVGVILLMFGVGLQFHLEELLAVRRIAVPGAVAQIVAATFLGAVVARSYGWDPAAGIVFGLALSVASTVVLLRVLTDNRDLHTTTGHVAVGWLVVEDLTTVLVLVLLPEAFGPGSGRAGLPVAVALTVLKVGGLVAFTLVVGNRAIPWILDRVAATRSRELFTLTVLVVALGIAVGSSGLFGVSMALGAFLAGMVVGRSDFSLRAASEALPMRDAFAVLFFVSVGMLLEPKALLDAPGLFVATLAVVVVGKPVAALLVIAVLRYPLRVGLAVAVALAQIGEFSFILAAMGKGLGVLPPAAANTIVAASIASILLNPLLYRCVPSVEHWVGRCKRLARLLDGAAALPEVKGRHEPHPRVTPDDAHRAVVVGYGPTGRILTRLLRDNGIEPTVVELDLETVRRMRTEGRAAEYGDATRRETLVRAGVASAGSFILAADVPMGEETIRLARELNPGILVLARAADLRGSRALRAAGAQSVFSGEGEVALALAETILERLGATPEQIDRERARVHAELSGDVAF